MSDQTGIRMGKATVLGIDREARGLLNVDELWGDVQYRSGRGASS
jgi:hypothetical protein